MSSIVGAITGGTPNGANFQATGVPLDNAVSRGQADQLYDQSQAALVQQQNFLQAVQAQNGLGNQSSVFNQLQGVANGTGPNPAQAQLAQATGANTANQAALMAGQRGSGANAGLIARQAGMQGGANQQAAAGQAATMQANQSLNALNQLGGIATNQANQQANATQALNSNTQSEQQMLLNQLTAQNNAKVGMQSNLNSTNQAQAGAVTKGQFDLIGNIAGGAGSAMGLAAGGMVPHYAEGGAAATALQPAPMGPKSHVGKFFSGNSLTAGGGDQQPSGMATAGQDIGKAIGKGFSAIGSMFSPSAPAAVQAKGPDPYDLQGIEQLKASGADPYELHNAAVANNVSDDAYAKGGKVKAMVSPGERYLSPKEAAKVAKGEKSPMHAGKKIPGKAPVSGAKDDYANDIVPAKLEAGGIVIPRSVTQAKDAEKKAVAFVRDVFAKKGMPRKPTK